jgi:hypothetical protein
MYFLYASRKQRYKHCFESFISCFYVKNIFLVSENDRTFSRRFSVIGPFQTARTGFANNNNL